MAYKIIAGIVAAALLLVYVGPVVLKLKNEFALWAVVLIGVVMMLVDLWQSLQSKED
jgi:hypothetical protein